MLVLSHDLYFCFQFDAALRTGHVFDLLNQLEHVRRGRASVINNEIAVHFRHARLSNARILKSQFINQLSGWARIGILENAACALGDWLRGAPFLL